VKGIRRANEVAGRRKPEGYHLRYVEDFVDLRTKLGARRVLARWGWAGGRGAFFSSLKGEE